MGLIVVFSYLLIFVPGFLTVYQNGENQYRFFALFFCLQVVFCFLLRIVPVRHPLLKQLIYHLLPASILFLACFLVFWTWKNFYS
jgi:hypothetical protein